MMGEQLKVSFLDKYRSMSPTLRASALFAICGIIQKGVSFLIVPIYTRIMPSEAYGQYSVFCSWYQLLMIFTTLNMWNYLINNGMTDFSEKRWDFIASLQGLAGALTLAWMVIYLPFSNIWELLTGMTLPMMLIMFAEFLTMPSFEYWCSVNRFDYKAVGVVILTVIIAVFTPVVAIPTILFSEDKGFAAILGRSIVPIVVYTVVGIRLLIRNRKVYDRYFWSYALRFNLPLVPHFLSMMLLASSDRIMIERMRGASDAAKYSVAYQAALALQIVNTAVLNSFVPYTYKALKDGDTEKIGKRATPIVMFVGGLNLFVSLFAPEVIGLLAPAEYQSAIYIIPPVAMSNMFMLLFNLFANVEYYYKETKMVAAASAISAVTNVVLNYIFIQKYGYIAAGYTTLFCYILFSICHYMFMRKVSRKHMGGDKIYNIKLLTIVVLLFTALSVFAVRLYDKNMLIYRYIFIVAIMVTLIIYRRKIVVLLRGGDL